MEKHPHKDEIIRWANSPEGTKVWVKNGKCGWHLVPYPHWHKEAVYIIDDEHAELRKEWIDNKPPIQYFDEFYGCFKDCANEPKWYLGRKYRIKPSEWDTPKGVDPIEYHAKRIDPDWKPDWNNSYQAKCLIMFSHENNYYKHNTFWTYEYINAVYISEKATIKIVEALNNGELKI